MKVLQAAALGKSPCDLILKNVTYLDVFSNDWRIGDVSLFQGKIVGLDSGLKANREINVQGKFLVPGFIDAHVHIESSLVIPKNFERSVLPLGTTSAVCDPHELTNVLGVKALEYFLNEASHLQLDLRVMLSSCVPATHLETNGGGVVSAKELIRFKNHPKALGLAEMMNVPGVLFGDEGVHDKLRAFQDRPIDGHCPLLRGRELSAYALTGISSCHESSELEEAQDKLTKGIAVWIREGSVAKDLRTLTPLLNLGSSLSIGFCTDDRNPLDIAHEGHLNYLVREAIRNGVDPKVAYRSASYSVALHYGMNHGLDRVGAIAPGYRADLILLDDVQSCSIHSVLKSGRFVNEIDYGRNEVLKPENTVHAKTVSEADLEGVQGRVHVIGVRSGRIITERSVQNHDHESVAKLSVVERHGKHSKPANAYVSGFGVNFKGAIASSVGHDSHNLIVVGKSTHDMMVAVNALKAMGGGFCVVKDGQVISKLALPFGGLMSMADSDEVKKSLIELRAASKSVGCELEEPFLQLAFLSLPVIPSLKLTDQGLVDVDQFKVIDVRAS
jgi:adenine deaminase